MKNDFRHRWMWKGRCWKSDQRISEVKCAWLANCATVAPILLNMSLNPSVDFFGTCSIIPKTKILYLGIFRWNSTMKDNKRLKHMCINYSRKTCASVEKTNSSSITMKRTDDEVLTILNTVSIRKNSSKCMESLENTLCLKKYLSCKNESSGSEDVELESQLSNETRKFCAVCFKYSDMKSNISRQSERHIWRNLSCISKLLGVDRGKKGQSYLYNGKNRTILLIRKSCQKIDSNLVDGLETSSTFYRRLIQLLINGTTGQL